jgi:hypothetical protein
MIHYRTGCMTLPEVKQTVRAAESVSVGLTQAEAELPERLMGLARAFNEGETNTLASTAWDTIEKLTCLQVRSHHGGQFIN